MNDKVDDFFDTDTVFYLREYGRAVAAHGFCVALHDAEIRSNFP
jgi:hypothetical protein